MPEPIVVIGCGGLGREVWAVIRAINEATPDRWDPLGFVDDGPTEVNLKRVARLGASFLGPVATLAQLDQETQYIIGIGDPRVRAAVARKVAQYSLVAAHLIHPTATVGPDTRIGSGVVLFTGAAVTTNVELGNHVLINQNASIGHDTVLEDYVTINPLAAISGDCHIGQGVMVGTTAAVLQGLRVGAGSTVGASACVVRDVPTDTVVKGVPAR
jgi:sugar O-acyltransferase (sialic acid O-acetyltransferase NeuD family)